MAFQKPTPCSQAEARSQMGPCDSSRVGDSSFLSPPRGAWILGRLRDFAEPPSSVGGNSSSLHDSPEVGELATLDRYHHFHGHSGLCT